MLTLMIGLTAVFLILLVVGFVWTLLASGTTTTYHRGEEVGATVAAERMEDEFEKGVTLAQKTTFKGEGIAAQRQTEISFQDMWKLVEQKRWREVLPWLLIFTGMIGFLFFGALALWFGMENKLVAGMLVVVVLYAVVRMLYAFARA